jgi:hypothetical protein
MWGGQGRYKDCRATDDDDDDDDEDDDDDDDFVYEQHCNVNNLRGFNCFSGWLLASLDGNLSTISELQRRIRVALSNRIVK